MAKKNHPESKKKKADLHPTFPHPPVNAAYLDKPVHLRKRSDRYEVGRALRVACPREMHSEFTLNRDDRPDVIELLRASDHGKIKHLVPIRYGRMLVSPFAFFRGTAAIMATDLDDTPTTGYAVQSCGDCHLFNFGAFATPERNVIFDINDFDETYPAPWEWDIKRLATSFVIASHNNGHSPTEARAAALQVVRAYRDKMRELAEMPALKAWYSYLDYEELIETTVDDQLKRRRKKILAKSLQRNPLDEYVKLAHVIDGMPRIKDNPPLIFHEESSEKRERGIKYLIESYRESLPLERRIILDRYELVDHAVKVVGVGSVGTYCAIGLFFASENDPLFLQIKEATPSVLAPYVESVHFESEGARVVFGQRLMQAASDIFLGHAIGDRGGQFYVRQLRDVKIKPLVEIFTPFNMLNFGSTCGWALARAHARSGDPAIISGYIGKGDAFPKAIVTFADAYSKQNESDYKLLLEAIDEGKIEAFSE